MSDPGGKEKEVKGMMKADESTQALISLQGQPQRPGWKGPQRVWSPDT